MKINSKFYNEQYKKNSQDGYAILDHSWYKYLLKYANGRVDVVGDYILTSGIHYTHCTELGCGDGRLYSIIEKKISTYIGMDISDYNLEKFTKQNPNICKQNLIQKDLNEKLSEIETNSQDLVISISTIEYLFDPYSLVNEANRILKTGGELILHTMNIAFLPRRFQLLFGKLPTFNNASGWQGGVLHNFTYSTLKELLEKNGFEVSTFYCSGIFPNFRKWWPGLLCGDLIFVVKKI